MTNFTFQENTLYQTYIRPRPNKENPKYYDAVLVFKDTLSGERHSQCIHCDTRSEADLKIAEAKVAASKNEVIAPSKRSLREYLEYWFTHYTSNMGLSDATLRDYRQTMDRYVFPTLGNVPLDKLDAGRLQLEINKMVSSSPVTGKPLSVNTVKHVKRLLNASLNQAVIFRLIPENPMKYIKLPKMPKKEMEIFSLGECKELLQLSKNDTEMHLLFLLAWDCLLRRGEFCALRWQDVDFDEGIVHVRHSIVENINDESVFKSCKTDASEREIKIMPETLAALRKQRIHYNELKLEHPEFYDGGFVFFQHTRNYGFSYPPSTFYNKYRRFLIQHNFKRLKMHALRHTGISLLMSMGVNPLEVQYRAGHSNLSVTMDVYSHANKKDQTANMVLSERLFREEIAM